MANTLAYEAIQCNKLCISFGGLRSHPTPPLERTPVAAQWLGEITLRHGKSTTDSYEESLRIALEVRRIKDEN